MFFTAKNTKIKRVPGLSYKTSCVSFAILVVFLFLGHMPAMGSNRSPGKNIIFQSGLHTGLYVVKTRCGNHGGIIAA